MSWEHDQNLSKCNFVQSRLNTIHRCLVALGATIKDVYLLGSNNCKGINSIYNRYSMEELDYMVEKLYKKSIKKYHIDLHFGSEDSEVYEEKTKTINEARQRALKILKNRITCFHY